jgi:prevent-host-death family protein
VAKIKIKDLEAVAATEAKLHFGEILHRASVDGQKFLVNRSGRPVAVILSYNEYVRLTSQKKGN